MVDITLSEFKFALPTSVTRIDGANEEYQPFTDFPQEFFGLSAKEQVSILDSLISAVSGQVKAIPPESEQKNESNEESSKLSVSNDAFFPLHIGLSLSMVKQTSLNVEIEFHFPDVWLHLPVALSNKVLMSMAYLYQSAAVAIVRREQKHGVSA